MSVLVRAFRRGGWCDSLDTADLAGPGRPRLALVPPVVADADHRWWLGHRPTPAPAPTERRAIVLEALDLFHSGTVTVGGLGRQSAVGFRAVLWEHAGLPEALSERWGRMLQQRTQARRLAPADDALAFVALPGSAFTCLDAVIEQAERSAAVWIRPSRREPWSAARMVASLLEAGWPPDRIGLYPGERGLLAALARRTDRQVVYGGQDLAGSVRDRPALTMHGAGRGCALVPAHLPVDTAADWLLPLIAADAGRFCSNVRSVVCAGEVGSLADELAARLSEIRPGPGERRFPLAAFRELGEAERAVESVTARIRPGDRTLTHRPATVPAPGGGAYALPRLVLLATPGVHGRLHPLIGHEVPFPFAAVVSATDPGITAAITARSLFVHRPDATVAAPVTGLSTAGER
ncbi:hypothetical protein [Streptomyces sp. R08]|uniref:Uncharacterized protein n=1 Tax=Streptomyces sp. R08 TaxID=3238624 RepID=A0AB39MQJ5_9ACTN